MTLRTLGIGATGSAQLAADEALKTSLLENDSFVYAHLVKIEKAIKTGTGDNSRKASDYAYITDAGYDLQFNDQSVDSQGNANGTRTYFANKLINTGTISETIEARAASITISLSAAALSTEANINFTTTSSTIQTDIDLVDAGFAEGDKVKLTVTSGASTNNNDFFIINSFSNNNKTANIDASLSSNSLSSNSSNRAGKLTFSSEEVIGLLNPKSNTSTYAGYINRDVTIYKAHINPETGLIIGSPYLLFKGIIASSKIDEDALKDSIITWNISSHWGDFVSVNGRLTSDQHHRALDGRGLPDISALKRKEYAEDLGFLHSEQAVNLVSIYQVMETKYKLKKKKKWYGYSKYKQIEYQEEVDRDVDLRFNLDAKYLPVVYGVQKLDSFPVFVDTLRNDSKKVYVAYAICEGEISSLYDIYFDDTSSICIDKNDFDTRSTQTTENTIDVLCKGRMDRGDVLGSTPAAASSYQNLGTGGLRGYGAQWINISHYETMRHEDNIPAVHSSFGSTVTAATAGAGITHEKGHRVDVPIDARIVFHSGKRGQKADNLLVSIAAQNNFKIQNDYFDNREEYWGRNHRLLDTAYVVVEYTIGEGETTIPSLDFVVRGKVLECYNYDYSYGTDPSETSAAITDFDIGDQVDIWSTSIGNTGSPLSTPRIADIYTFKDATGTNVQRVRFDSDPLGGMPFTEFFMRKGSSNYYFETYNNIISEGAVAEKLEEALNTSATTTGSNSGVRVTINDAASAAAAALQISEFMSVYDSINMDPDLIENLLRANFSFNTTGTAGQIDDLGDDSAANFNSAGINTVAIKDAVSGNSIPI